MNEYEIGLEDRKTKKRWAGENYGWQSKESYDKLYTQGKLNPVQQQIDRVTSSVSRAVMSAPVAGPAIKAVQSGIRFAYEALPTPVQQTVTKGLETTQTAAENIAAATGLPVSLTDPLTIADIGTGGASALASKGVRQAVKTGVKGLADDLMTPPTGMVPALAGVGGGVRFTPKPTPSLLPTISPITTSEQWRAPGMVEGVAKQPKYKKALTERRMSVADIEIRRQQRIAEGKSNLRSLDAEKYGRSSTLMTDPNDPYAYGKTKYKEMDPTDPGFLMHQHHLFPKGGSYAFLERMEQLITSGIADQDDLVNMFAWAEKLDVTMGNRLSNMLNTPAGAHIGKGGIHPSLRVKQLEMSVQDVQQLVASAANADQVMEMFNNYILTKVKPSKKLAQDITKNYLNNKKYFTKPERSAMEEFIAQLRERGA